MTRIRTNGDLDLSGGVQQIIAKDRLPKEWPEARATLLAAMAFSLEEERVSVLAAVLDCARDHGFDESLRRAAWFIENELALSEEPPK